MSPRPGRIIEEIALPFARPRTADLVTSSAFIELKRHCLALLHPEGKSHPLARLTPLGITPAAIPASRLQFAI